MSVRSVIERVLNYSPLVAATIYGAVVIALLATTWLALAGIYSGESALAETSTLLERLQGRKAAPLADGGTMTGSPAPLPRPMAPSSRRRSTWPARRAAW